MFFNNNKKESLFDKLELSSVSKSDMYTCLYGIIYSSTNYYLIIMSLFLLFLSYYYWLGFLLLLLCNLIRWKNISRMERSLFYLNKNEIIQAEFTSEIWWLRAELNAFDLYNLVIRDFDSLINYLNILLYNDFLANGLYIKKNLNLLNNNFNAKFTTKFIKKIKLLKKKNNIKLNLKDKLLLNSKNKFLIVYKKKHITKYLNQNYLNITYLNNFDFYNKRYLNYFVIFNNNFYSFKHSWNLLTLKK